MRNRHTFALKYQIFLTLKCGENAEAPGTESDDEEAVAAIEIGGVTCDETADAAAKRLPAVCAAKDGCMKKGTNCESTRAKGPLECIRVSKRMEFRDLQF